MALPKIPRPKIRQYKRVFRAALFILWVNLFVAGIVATIYFFRKYDLEHGFEILQRFAGENTMMIVLIIFGLYLVRSIIFIPVSFLGVALGVVLTEQPLLAIIIASIGATLAAFLSFGIARALGREWIAKHETARLKKFDTLVRERGFFTIFILRLLLFIPFDLVSLLSGFSAIAFWDYALGTMLGVIPEVATQVLIGNSLMHPKHFFLVAAIFIAVFVLGYFFKMNPRVRHILNPAEKVRKVREKRKMKKGASKK